MVKCDETLHAIIPPLTDEEHNLLEHSILSEGCRDPLIIWAGQNVIVDGHNRFEICNRHGLPFDVLEMSFTDRREVVDWICKNQLGRRNLTDAGRSDLRGKRYNNSKQRVGGDRKSIYQNDKLILNTHEAIAAEEGVGSATVTRAGKFSEALDTLEGLGIERAEFTSGRRKTRKGHVEALADIAKEDPDTATAIWQHVVDQGETSGAIKSAIRTVHNEQAIAALPPTSDDTISILHGDFVQLTDSIEYDSIDAIITDPPYPYEFIELWSSLAEVAMRVLKPGGWCITYSGKQHLDEVLARMTAGGLVFYWQVIFRQTVTAAVHARSINTQYKPILLFQKPPLTKPDTYFMDVIDGQQVEKDMHEWQQSKDGFAWLIEQFTNVGDMILEPFCGSGTTPLVARQLNRRCIAYEIDKGVHAAACGRVFTPNTTKIDVVKDSAEE